MSFLSDFSEQLLEDLAASMPGYVGWKAINAYQHGLSNLQNLADPYLVLAESDGERLEEDSLSANHWTVRFRLYVHQGASATQFEDLTSWAELLAEYLNSYRPGLDGFLYLRVDRWEIGVSDDGAAEGLLAMEFSVTYQVPALENVPG